MYDDDDFGNFDRWKNNNLPSRRNANGLLHARYDGGEI